MILWEFHIVHPNSTFFSRPSISALHLVAPLPKEENKNINKTATKLSPLLLSSLSISSSFLLVALGAALGHAVDPFVQIFLLANVHGNELLVWFKDSGLCHTMNTGRSLKLLLDILLLPWRSCNCGSIGPVPSHSTRS